MHISQMLNAENTFFGEIAIPGGSGVADAWEKAVLVFKTKTHTLP